MQEIILASGSQSRKLALSILGLPFRVVPANIDEKAIRDADLAVRVERIAKAKAEKVSEENPGIIISGDTFIEFENTILEKPNDSEEAKKMLEQLSTRKAHVYTGICYIDREKNLFTNTSVIITCLFRKFTSEEIDHYVTMFPVTEWAGSFSTADPYGSTVAAEIHGSYTGFTYGFPLEIIIPLLRESGFSIFPHSPFRILQQ